MKGHRMGREGHSHSLRNFQSILVSLTIRPRTIPNLLPAPGTQTMLASSTQTAVTHPYQQIHVSTHRPLFSPFPCQGSLIPSTQGDTCGTKRLLLWHKPCWQRTARVTGHCSSSTTTAQLQPSLQQPWRNPCAGLRLGRSKRSCFCKASVVFTACLKLILNERSSFSLQKQSTARAVSSN